MSALKFRFTTTIFVSISFKLVLSSLVVILAYVKPFFIFFDRK